MKGTYRQLCSRRDDHDPASKYSTTKHFVSPLFDFAFLNQVDEQVKSLLVHQVLAEVKEDRFTRSCFEGARKGMESASISSKQFIQIEVLSLVGVVSLEQFPCC